LKLVGLTKSLSSIKNLILIKIIKKLVVDKRANPWEKCVGYSLKLLDIV